MWRLLCCLSLLVSLRADEIRGIVRDALTREPLSRVALTCGAARAETSAGGRFSVTCTTPPLTAATVGYRAFTVTEFPKEAELEIELFPAALRRQESVTVSAGPLGAETPGSATLQGVELENLASVLADDPLRAAQALPGVVANDDFSAALSLRGAGFDRVGLYYDGILVRQPFHSVQGESTSGSLTIFNSDLLEALQLYPSAPPLRLPDRTAGALDLQPRDGDRRKLSTRFTASASNAAALVEGPLPKGSWLAAVRQSYLQYIIERTAPDNASLAFGFTDGQARLRRDLTARHSAVVNLTAGQSGGDRSRLARTAGANTLIESDYRFTLASLSLRSQWNESVTSTITAAHLRERAENRNREGSALYGSDYRESVVNAAASAGLRASGVLEFGASFRRMRDDGFVYRYTFVPATVRPLDRFRGAGLRSAGFAQAGRG
ncbi:MAG TPA: hypothetical protein DEH78_20435, partial [Solibacterales bacterium]|nr:hypothetical protein [Bryobacterales bacterium]